MSDHTTDHPATDVRRRLSEVFAAMISDEVELRDDLTADQVEEWDSLTHVNFMFAVEEEFGVQLSQREMVLADIGELEQVLHRKLGSRNS
jgi:acyl carrier protein